MWVDDNENIDGDIVEELEKINKAKTKEKQKDEEHEQSE